jgi:CheY-like chemotaxis protein
MKKILIIDDDAVFAKIYEGLFQAEGYLVEVAMDGASAIEMLRYSKPDLVLLDLFLGKVNGVQVLKFIRSRIATSELPVIAFSNSSTSRLVNAAWLAGASKFLAKDDFDPDYLLDIVHQILSAPQQPLASENLPASTLQPSRPLAAVGYSGDLISDADRTVQANLRQRFLSRVPQVVAGLRNALEILSKSGPADQAAQLTGLRQSVEAIAENAGVAGCHTIGHLCRLLAALLKELSEETALANPSSLQTAGVAVDFLPVLIEDAIQGESLATAMILVLDDDSTSRWTICSALEMANLKSISLGEPSVALKFLDENRFDLILLDLRMPGMNGFELCTRIRGLPTNKTTPIIFVTGRADFESRARAVLTGGNDMIAKPFLLGDLALKALTFVLKGQIKATAKSG